MNIWSSDQSFVQTSNFSSEPKIETSRDLVVSNNEEISFESENIEYVGIQLDENKNLTTTFTKDEHEFVEKKEVGDGVFIEKTIEDGEIKNFSGLITNPEILSQFPKPSSKENALPLVALVLAGIAVVGIAVSVGVPTLAGIFGSKKSSLNNNEIRSTKLAINDYSISPNSNTLINTNSTFLSTDGIEYTNENFYLKRNNETYLNFTKDNIEININKCIGRGSTLLTVDKFGNIGVADYNIVQSNAKCVIKILNAKVQILKCFNVKDATISNNIIRIQLVSKMDIYQPRIKVVSSKNENVKCKIISDIIAETDFLEFEVSDVESETILSINVQ